MSFLFSADEFKPKNWCGTGVTPFPETQQPKPAPKDTKVIIIGPKTKPHPKPIKIPPEVCK